MATPGEGNYVTDNDQTSAGEAQGTTLAEAAPAQPAIQAGPAPEVPGQVPAVIRIWRRMRREPSLMVTVAYLFVSFIGLWANYWFYEGFNLPVLEYMQASDYLVAGLRDPAYALVLLATFVLIVLVSAPDIYRRRHPERVQAWRRKWWARVVFPENKWLRWKGFGLAPETGVTLAVVWGMLWATQFYVDRKGDYIRGGRSGHAVVVTMAGDRSPLPQAARLLGSSSTFVFLWWPHARVAEAVPIESIARLQSLPLRKRTESAASKPAARTGTPAATAAPPAGKR